MSGSGNCSAPPGYAWQPHLRFMIGCGVIGLVLLSTVLVVSLVLPPPFSPPALPTLPDFPADPPVGPKPPSGPYVPVVPEGPR